MPVLTNQREFLVTQVPELLKKLRSDTEPNFGLMTAQHMVEHLIDIADNSTKRHGEPEGEPTETHLWFKDFIANGAVPIQHRPEENKTRADLPPLRYPSMEAAMEEVPRAIQRFYDFYQKHPGFISYSPIFGELSFEEMEVFHLSHYRYHLWQFGLIEVYP